MDFNTALITAGVASGAAVGVGFFLGRATGWTEGYDSAARVYQHRQEAEACALSESRPIVLMSDTPEDDALLHEVSELESDAHDLALELEAFEARLQNAGAVHQLLWDAAKELRRLHSYVQRLSARIVA